jgi:hypothetical protein
VLAAKIVAKRPKRGRVNCMVFRGIWSTKDVIRDLFLLFGIDLEREYGYSLYF